MKSNNRERINILCSSDNNYVAYCGIMLTSLVENNRGNEIVVYLLTDGLDDKEVQKFHAFEKKYNTTVNIVTVRKESFKHCPVREGDHVSLTAYYRIVCADLLPEDLHKIIYLDCDIMVKCDLHSLWNYDITGKAMGVVVDGWHIANEQRLDFELKTYFNSGVLLINLDFFRDNDIALKCLNYINDYPEIIKLHDQDALNIICHDDLLYLPLRYNMQTAFLRVNKTFDDSMCDEINTSLSDGDMIVHFDAFPKPWSKYIYVEHPFTKEWRMYRKKSLWMDTRLTTDVPLKYKFNVRLFQVFWALGIKNAPKEYIC